MEQCWAYFENWQLFTLDSWHDTCPIRNICFRISRRIWRQLTLLEDAMMAYRIVRVPERRIFKIDVGGIAPQDVEHTCKK